MKSVVFFDTEVTEQSKKLFDIGAVRTDGAELHTISRSRFISFIVDYRYLCEPSHEGRLFGSSVMPCRFSA